MNKICIVPGCAKPIRATGLCGKHYERVRAHGNVNTDLRATGSAKCDIIGCPNKAIALGWCGKHYQRFCRHGSTNSRLPTYGSYKVKHTQGYIRIWTGKRYVMEHVLLAEKALGKPLPKGAVVHHMNGNPADNHTPLNLVICPDQAYHLLLHRRMKERS